MEQLQRKRVVLCRGEFCNMGRRADKLYKRLEEALGEINRDSYPKPVKLEIANCLSMCGAGPNLVIYPAGEIFNHLDAAALDVVIETCLKP
jgi:NADH:ubiquinone oxidoreductase subunit E